MNLLEGLNEQQLAAVKHVNGPLLVVAGAGTGKTQVITRRIAYLIREQNVKPGEILALTFTEKAAREMSDRLFGLIGWESFSVPVLTFNAFGSGLLNEYSTHIGRSTRGGLINDIQKVLLLRQRLGEISFQYYGMQQDTVEWLEGIVGYISKLQNAGITPGMYTAYVQGLDRDPGDFHPADILEQSDLAQLYALYEKIKTETGTFDYFDQLAVPLHTLEQKPNLANRLSKKYKYVLVDEYQDTSPIQDALLRQIVSPEGNIFAVGDDDQAIYGFRGADIENILRFTDYFQVAKPLALTANYRSGQPILDAAYRVIQNNNPERLEHKLGLVKRLTAQSSDAEVNYRPYQTAADEQSFVIDEVAERLKQGEAAVDIAVLARSNNVLKNYAKVLRQRGINYAISTSVDIFEQRELKSLWYLLEWIGHKARDEAITHVLMSPFIKCTAGDVRRVIERSGQDLCSSEEALRTMSDESEPEAKRVIELLNQWREWAQEYSVSQVAYKLVFETGLADSLAGRGQNEPRIVRVFEDLHRLLSHMQDFEGVQTDTSLGAYLAVFPKPPAIEVHETTGDSEGVQLLTVHASKGLEFATVYVVGCTARAWSEPSSGGSLQVPVQLKPESELPAVHEQRRLMYVAVTRAKKHLFISASVQSAGGQRQAVSPLLTELFNELPQIEPITHNKGGLDKSLKKLQRLYPLQEELPDRLPFESSDGWITLGVGDLERYELSPHDFYLQKVLGIVQPFGPQLAFGSAIHGVIQAYYETKLRGDEPSLNELLSKLDEMWSDQGYESRELADTAHRRAADTIRRFVIREEAEDRRVKATELPIRLELPEYKLRLRGRIDATIDTVEGLEIRDFKTGGLSDPDRLKDKAKSSFQLRTYALAIQQLTGAPPTWVTLDYVVTGAEGQAALTSRILDNHRTKLGDLAERLRHRDFAPGTASSFNQPAAYKYYGTEDDEVIISA